MRCAASVAQSVCFWAIMGALMALCREVGVRDAMRSVVKGMLLGLMAGALLASGGCWRGAASVDDAVAVDAVQGDVDIEVVGAPTSLGSPGASSWYIPLEGAGFGGSLSTEAAPRLVVDWGDGVDRDAGALEGALGGDDGSAVPDAEPADARGACATLSLPGYRGPALSRGWSLERVEVQGGDTWSQYALLRAVAISVLARINAVEPHVAQAGGGLFAGRWVYLPVRGAAADSGVGVLCGDS